MITICLGTDVHNVFLFAGMHVRRLVTNGLIALRECHDPEFVPAFIRGAVMIPAVRWPATIGRHVRSTAASYGPTSCSAMKR